MFTMRILYDLCKVNRKISQVCKLFYYIFYNVYMFFTCIKNYANTICIEMSFSNSYQTVDSLVDIEQK